MKQILFLVLVCTFCISCRSYRTGHSKSVSRDFIVEDFIKDYRDKFTDAELKALGAGFRVSKQVELIAPPAKTNIVSFKENRLQEGNFAHFTIGPDVYGQIIGLDGDNVWVKFDAGDSIPVLCFTLDVETKTYELTGYQINTQPFTPGIIADFPLALTPDGTFLYLNCKNGTKAYFIDGKANATLQMVKEKIPPSFKNAHGVK